MAWSCVLFDLDGTLTDPYEGITKSIQYALERMGAAVADRRELAGMIGPPLRDSFMARYGMTGGQAEEALAHYRAYFGQTGLYENRVYDGAPEMLARLRGAGLRLALCTTKPEVYARRILAHFGLDGYFDAVGGPQLDGTHDQKGDLMAHMIAEGMVDAPERCLMVGDRRFDVEAARANGVAALGVSYGYGSLDELRACGPLAIVDSPAAVADWIMGGR